MQKREKSDEQGTGKARQDRPALLLDIIGKLDLELHPHKKTPDPVALDTSLDRDLGLDSLGRVELLARLEQAFGVSLPDSLLTAADTPRDLLRVLPETAPEPVTSPPSRVLSAALEEVETYPDRADNLLDVLDWHAERTPDRQPVRLLGEEEEEISYSALRQGAEAVAGGLFAHDLQAGQTVAIMLPTGREYLESFFGVLAAGGIPVPIYPPVNLSQLEDHLRRHARILSNAQVSVLITVPEGKLVARLLKSHVETLHTVITAPELAAARQDQPERPRPVLRGQDIAFLQYTSGSTGDPRGVVLTHANLLANIRAMGAGLNVQSSDVIVSWLPLYHDLGLIGAWLGSLYFAMPLVLMSPLRFLARPERWLWAIHTYRGTISAGANFAFELCLRRIKDENIEGLDLSSWRVAANGAEPVSPDTIERFTRRFGDYGFRPESMVPVYGLAECSVGLAFPRMGERPVVDSIDRQRFIRAGRAEPSPEGEGNPLRFVACGQPLRGHQIRIVDEAGHELGEREEGRLQFKGPSATSGFYRNPEATRELFDGEWLESGDLAYMAGGQIFLTGRVKDVVIRAGRNIYPHELEEAAGNIPGVRKGCVAVFGNTDQRTGTERLILVAETRETSSRERERLRREITKTAIDLLGAAPENIILAQPHSILKTSSGKIRRAATRQLYEQGHLSGVHRSLWLQLLRIAKAGFLPEFRRWWRHLGALAYRAYFFVMLGCVAASVWSLVVLLRRPALAWPVVRVAARFFLQAVRLPLVVRDLENLPTHDPVLLAVNHASYLDGVVLSAALPGNYSYVAKRELLRRFVPRIFLKNLGTQFVERFDTQQSVEDARGLMDAARAGRSLVFFPEGTFQRVPGLLPFQLGAFMVAAENAMPVVPVTIRGTRSVLRDERWFPRRGAISVQVGKPIVPRNSNWSEAIRLRDTARAQILKRCGEPDLAGQPKAS